ncbi:MAG: peptide chain release factor-like protein, partial [Deltaproteobacteria bacterium]|nr:peptide chain release factor-like protein [Deltaproteobacteria bacterium]
MSNQFISAEKIKMLEDRMRCLGIEERDIEEKFIHSQGRGGQKVNKSSSCVYLKHLPTGIEVKCQEARSQAMNRFFARRILSDKVEEALHGSKSGS